MATADSFSPSPTVSAFHPGPLTIRATPLGGGFQ